MSVIILQDFRAIYGEGRPPVKGSLNYTPEADVRILTALADHFKVKRCLEIGCNIGATAAAVLAGNKTITEYVGVDLRDIWYDDGKVGAGHLAKDDKRFKLMQLGNGARDIDTDEIGKFDFIFIDGAHDYESVKADTELAHKLLVSGVIVWHDYQHPKNPDVTKFIHDINDKPGVAEIVWVKKTWTCYKIIQEKLNEPERGRKTKAREVLGADREANE